MLRASLKIKFERANGSWRALRSACCSATGQLVLKFICTKSAWNRELHLHLKQRMTPNRKRVRNDGDLPPNPPRARVDGDRTVAMQGRGRPIFDGKGKGVANAGARSR